MLRWSVLLVLVFYVGIAPVFACTQPPPPLPPTPSLEENIANASLILVGTVTSGTSDGSGMISDAEIALEILLKGESSASIIITGFGSSSLCRPTIQVGQRALFFATEGFDGKFFILRLVISPSESSIAEISAITNQAISFITPTSTETATSSTTPSRTPSTTPSRTPSSTATDTATHTLTATMTASSTLTATENPSATSTATVVPLIEVPASPSNNNTPLILLGIGLMLLGALGFGFLWGRRSK